MVQQWNHYIVKIESSIGRPQLKDDRDVEKGMKEQNEEPNELKVLLIDYKIYLNPVNHKD